MMSCEGAWNPEWAQARIEELERQLTEARARVVAMAEALQGILQSPREFEDDRLRYVTMQIYRKELRDAETALTPDIAAPVEHAKRGRQALELLEELGPGGSEFVGDPARCAEWVKDELRNRSEGWKKATIRAKEAVELAKRQAEDSALLAKEPQK